MAERNENAVSSNDSSIIENAKPRYSAKTTEYLSFPMLLLIFKYLSVYDLLLRVGLVCKSWYHVARDRELWMTVDLSRQQKLKPRDLLKLLSFSNFRIIDLRLPHRAQEGPFSVHEKRLLILLLRKCQCLRVLQLCKLYWESLSTDAVQEANSSLEIKFDCCEGALYHHWCRRKLYHVDLYYTDSIRLLHEPLCDKLLPRRRYDLAGGIVASYMLRSKFYFSERLRIFRPDHFGNFGCRMSFPRSFTYYNKSLKERRIIIQDRILEIKRQDVHKSGHPKPSLRPYSNIMRQARKCPRQKYELRPPLNIVKQTKRYHQPRKGHIKRSGQKHNKP